jgi:hypothetical protein
MDNNSKRPPKLLLPTRASTVWHKVFLLIIGATLAIYLGPVILYGLGFGPKDVVRRTPHPSPIPVPDLGTNNRDLQIQAEKILKDLPNNPRPSDIAKQLTDGAKAVPVIQSGSIVLNFDGITINTVFGRGWSQSTSGRQTMIANDSKGVVCQSVLLPLKEYTEMMQSHNGRHTEVVKDLLNLQATMFRQKGLTASVTADTLFEEAIPNERVGVVGKLYIPKASATIPTYAVYAVKPPHAASLMCAPTGRELDAAEALTWLKGYNFND